MKINIKIHSLLYQKPTDITHAFIELKEWHFLYNVRFHADEPKNEGDPELGFENVLNIYEIYASKRNVVGFEKTWLTRVKLFQISIIVHGFTNDIRVQFKRESEADEFVRVLEDWLYNPISNEKKPEAQA